MRFGEDSRRFSKMHSPRLDFSSTIHALNQLRIVGDTDQAFVATTIGKIEFVGIETKPVQNCRMQVAYMIGTNLSKDTDLLVQRE
jgi:hypothetical protein